MLNFFVMFQTLGQRGLFMSSLRTVIILNEVVMTYLMTPDHTPSRK